MKSDLTTEEIRRRKREKRLIAILIPFIIALSFTEYFLIKNSIHLPKWSNLVVFAIININTILLLLLAFLILRNLVKFIFEDRSKFLGAKLRTKLVVAFVVLTFVPTIMLFVASIQFLSTSLNYWFDAKVEQSLKDALKLGKAYYDNQIYQIRLDAQTASNTIKNDCITDNGFNRACIIQLQNKHISQILNRHQYHCVSLELILPTYERVLALYAPPLTKPPPPIPVSLLQEAFQGKMNQSSTLTLPQGDLLRVMYPIRGPDGKVGAIVVTGGIVPHHINKLLNGIKAGYTDYKQLLVFKNPIKFSLLSILCLITSIILFSAIWYGIRLAKGITEPVQMLSKAAYRIAEGDLDFKLEVKGKDELHSLVHAFNTMTQELKEAKTRADDANKKLRRSNVELEQRRHYMEIILQNVAAGIISLDSSGVITTMNRSAEHILDMPSETLIGRHYSELLTPEQNEQFETIKQELASIKKPTLQRSIRIVLGSKALSLLVSFSLLKDQYSKELGMVLVFDDLTELERIQRIAAWREVARRIAHEVKNPLTPIKLSAQRLRKRYLKQIKDKEEQDVFDRCITTIVNQVEELKRLVNEFSKFARMPAPKLQPANLDKIVEDVLVLYRQAHKNIDFNLNVINPLPEIPLDVEQIKRAIINLIDNAVAAIDDPQGKVTIDIDYDVSGRKLTMTISDTGHGVSPQDKARLFEPYFSTKQGGTGLGLAIVNKIIQDHNGTIKIEDNKPKGTKFILTFSQTA